MTAFDYSGLLASAQALIQKFGRSITFLKLDSDPANMDKPWLGATAPRSAPAGSATLYGVNVPVSSLADLGGLSKTDDLLRECELAFVVEAQGDDLSLFHILQDGSSDYKIKVVRTLAPGDTTMLFAIGACR